jgi:hypothetical protein
MLDPLCFLIILKRQSHSSDKVCEIKRYQTTLGEPPLYGCRPIVSLEAGGGYRAATGAPDRSHI